MPAIKIPVILKNKKLDLSAFLALKKYSLIFGLVAIALLAMIYVAKPFLVDFLNKLYTREKSEIIARNWMVSKCPTYIFDGKKITLEDNINISSPNCPTCYKFFYSFESSHRGYGDRSKQDLPEATIPHKTVITVKSGGVSEAITDNEYDEIKKTLLENPETVKIKLFYQNLELVNQIGDVCSLESLGFVERQIPKTDTVIFDTINLLIKGQLEISEKTAGFYTEFSRQEFKLTGAFLDKENLILQFAEVPGFTNGNACRNMIMRAQLEKTALQFSEVKTVQITPESLFQY